MHHLNVIQAVSLTIKAGINGGLAGWNLVLAYLASFNADRVGRRPLWLVSTGGMLVSYIIITGLSVSTIEPSIAITYEFEGLTHCLCREASLPIKIEDWAFLSCRCSSYTMAFMTSAGLLCHVKSL